MQLNVDLFVALLSAFEKDDLSTLGAYDREDILYHVRMLVDEGFITGSEAYENGDRDLDDCELKLKGHLFLIVAREEGTVTEKVDRWVNDNPGTSAFARMLFGAAGTVFGTDHGD